MSKNKPGFVCVHGAWHDGSTWAQVAPILVAAGYEVAAIDLPGAGKNAHIPQSYTQDDLGAFGTEPSPNAVVTQADRNTALVEMVRDVAAKSNGSVILVGHSFGGLSVAQATEQVPELVAAAVFLTAFMLPNGMPAIAMIQDETMSTALVPSLFMADPEKVGALRLKPNNTAPDYQAKLKDAFYADVAQDTLDAFLPNLHPDEPIDAAIQPSIVTPEKFGSVARCYIRCTDDRAIPLTGQDHMIALIDKTMPAKTSVTTLHASHSPFLSQPKELSDILLQIAKDNG